MQVDEEWGRRRCFSEDKMAGLYAGKPAAGALGRRAESELGTIAKRAIEGGLEACRLDGGRVG